MDSPIFVYMQVSTITRSGFSKPMLACLAAYLLGLVALFIPAEIIVNDGQRFAVSLWFQHTGKIVGAFLLGCGLVQLIWWRQTRQWLNWPGGLCGVFVLLFAVDRAIHLYEYSSLTRTSEEAGLGLYLLAMAALKLVGASLILTWPKKAGQH